MPKQILQLMNVEGMTRENVASHLQKYRLHLKPSAQGSSLPPEQPPPPKAQQFDQQVSLSDTGISQAPCRFFGGLEDTSSMCWRSVGLAIRLAGHGGLCRLFPRYS